MPEQPKLDPLCWIIERGHAELYKSEGNLYLILAKKFPAQKTEYGKLAYDALVESISRQALRTSVQSQALLFKADAARIVGDMNDHFHSLWEGANIAFQTNNEKQKTKALSVLNGTPRSWRTDARYTELRKLLIPPMPIH